MSVFRNLKGTSKTEFRLGLSNKGSGLYGGTVDPSGSYTVSTGDVWFDKNNQRLAIRTSSNTWTDVTNTSVIDNRITNFTNNDATFAQNVTVTGNLTVSGTTTTINTQELNIADNEIVLNSDLASNVAATANAGILVNRGNEGNVFFRWDEGEGEWTINGETFNAGSFVGNLSGNVTGSIAPNGAPNVVRANTLIVNGSYTLPSADGTNKQVMTSDGAGSVSFTSLTTLADTFVGGSDSYVQFNDDDNFHGVSTFAYNKVTDTLTVPDVSIAGNIVPTANVTYDLGTSSNRFKDLYLSGNTINLGTTSISINADNEVDFTDSANSSIKRKLIVDEIELGTGNNKVVLRKGSDGKFEQKSLAKDSNSESAVKVNLDDNDSDDLPEGSTNLYFTNARANSAIDAKLTGNLTFGEVDTSTVSSPIFETVSDYGSVASSTTNTINYGNLTDAVVALVNSDYGVVESSGGPVEFPQYEVTSVPDASSYTGHMIFVPNESGGAVMAFSDGTNWRRVTDRAVISS